MATTPFSTSTVTYSGQALARVKAAPSGMRTWWLGKAGSLIQLPYPSNGYEIPSSSQETATTLLSGGTAVTRDRLSKRSWQLTWARIGGRDLQIVNGFYKRVFGLGPWCFLPPEEVNRLDLAMSMCGALNGALEGWNATGGTIAYDSTVTSPVPPCGVLRWTGAGSGSLLVAGPVVSGTPTPDPLVSIPYLPAEPVTVSMWAWTASSTASVIVRASGRLANGTVSTEASSSSITLNTTPQLVSVTAAAGALGSSQYPLPVLRCGTASAPNILVSAPQVELYSSATSWAAGSGVPRVTIPAAPTRAVSALLMANVAMTLAEV